MKDIISAILACALASGSDINLIDSIKEDYCKAFIKGEFNKAIPEDLENLNVENHLVFLDKNDKLRKSFNGSAKTLYSGNNKDEACRICESFLKDCPDFYCVDYTKIYNK